MGYNRNEVTQPPCLCPSELVSDLMRLLVAVNLNFVLTFVRTTKRS